MEKNLDMITHCLLLIMMAVGVELLVPPGDTQAIDGTVFTLELPTASVIAMLPLGEDQF